MFFLKSLFGFFPFAFKHLRSFLLNKVLLASNIFAVLLLTHAVTAIQTFFQGAVKFVLLFFAFGFESPINLVHPAFVLLQHLFFLVFIQLIVAFDLHHKLIVFCADVTVVVNGKLLGCFCHIVDALEF